MSIDVIQYRGRLVELTVFCDMATDEWVVECMDLAPDGGMLCVFARDAADVLELRPEGLPIPVDLLERLVAFAADHLPAGSTDDEP